MAATLEETLISVWQQALVDNARSVKLENQSFPVRRTSRSRLPEVDFQFEGHQLRGLEQNPETEVCLRKIASRIFNNLQAENSTPFGRAFCL